MLDNSARVSVTIGFKTLLLSPLAPPGKKIKAGGLVVRPIGPDYKAFQLAHAT